jgi:hypothetical protein
VLEVDVELEGIEAVDDNSPEDEDGADKDGVGVLVWAMVGVVLVVEPPGLESDLSGDVDTLELDEEPLEVPEEVDVVDEPVSELLLNGVVEPVAEVVLLILVDEEEDEVP